MFVLALGRTAGAQSDVSSKAAAEGLFDQGRELMKKGDFANACGYLERSQQIDPAVGTLLYLAECYEKTGRTASAWATFREAASAARAAGQMDRARIGEERAERLTPVLSKLIIEVSDAARATPGLVIRRQGQTVPPAAWNVAVPLDPGQYRIEASAPGYQDHAETVQVSDGAATARVSIPPLVPAPSAPATPQDGDPPSEPAVAPAPHTPAQPAPGADLAVGTRGSTQRTLAYVIGGAGIAGIAVGSVFGLRAISKNDEAKEHCPRSPQCDDALGVTLTNEADDLATISNIAFGLGAAALVGGVVLFLTAPDSESPQSGLSATLTPSGIWLKGAF